MRRNQMNGLFGCTPSRCCFGFLGLVPCLWIPQALPRVASSVFGVDQSFGVKFLGSCLTGRKSDSPLIYSLQSGRSWVLASPSEAATESAFSTVWSTGSRVFSLMRSGATFHLKRLIRASMIGTLKLRGLIPEKRNCQQLAFSTGPPPGATFSVAHDPEHGHALLGS